MDIQGMMAQAQQFEKQFKEDLQKMAVIGISGGNAVKVTVNGAKEITNIEIQPVAMKDADLLADYILAASNDAYRKVEAELANKMPGNLGSALSNIDLSSLGDLFRK